MKLKIIADHKIPFITEFFGAHGDIILLPGEQISSKDLQHADILLTRTVTCVNEKLLSNTPVKWVGSATTGIDHVDTQWLAQQSISFADAAGANAMAVVDYVFCCIAALKTQGLIKHNMTAGVIGCGRIGSRVAKIFQSLGFSVMCYDPLLTDRPTGIDFVSLETLLQQSDLISIHTPLTTTGYYPTHHLIDAQQLSQMKSDVILINTARGGVISHTALNTLGNKKLCLDVWENEPDISLELLNQVIIGTPHIAGYSLSAKYNATKMIYEKAASFFRWQDKTLFSLKTMSNQSLINPAEKNALERALAIYNPLHHTQQCKTAFQSKQFHAVRDIFIHERKNYMLRPCVLLTSESL